MDFDRIKRTLVPIFIGVSGALMGSTYGGGVGRSLPELLLALFLILFASIFSIEFLISRSREHLFILFSGAIVGLSLEFFMASTILIVIGGVVVGVCALPLLSSASAVYRNIISTAPLIFYAFVIIIGFSILTPICIWALSRGILRETLMALAFLTSPFWVGFIIRKLG